MATSGSSKKKNPAAVRLGKLRFAKLTPEERVAWARKIANIRWAKRRKSGTKQGLEKSKAAS